MLRCACAGFAAWKITKRRREAKAAGAALGTPKGGQREGMLGSAAPGSAGSSPTSGSTEARSAMYLPPGMHQLGLYHPPGVGEHMYHPPDQAPGSARSAGSADPARVAAMLAAVKADAQRSVSQRLPSHRLEDMAGVLSSFIFPVFPLLLGVAWHAWPLQLAGSAVPAPSFHCKPAS